MAFALIFIGILLAVSAVRGTTGDLTKLVQADFTGSHSFIWWLVVVIVIGAIGYLPPFRTLSRGMLLLVILALILTRGNPNAPQGGFFSQIISEINKATSTQSNSGVVNV